MHTLPTVTPVRAIREPVKEVVGMMYQTVENTAYCLNCTNKWPAMWDVVEKEPTAVCPKCQWRLGVPLEFVSSGWWTTEELAA
jgi:hypothetical protein